MYPSTEHQNCSGTTCEGKEPSEDERSHDNSVHRTKGYSMTLRLLLLWGIVVGAAYAQGIGITVLRCAGSGGIPRVIVYTSGLPECVTIGAGLVINRSGTGGPVLEAAPAAQRNQVQDTVSMTSITISAQNTFVMALSKTPAPGTLIDLRLRTAWGEASALVPVAPTNPKSLTVTLLAGGAVFAAGDTISAAYWTSE